jgi:tetratricopeptide (TPR) repeat protein
MKLNARAYIIRGNCRYLLDDYRASIEDYNSALTWYSDYYGSENKERAGIYYYLGRNKQQLGRYNDAISDFNSALSYNYSSPGYAYWNRGSCYHDLGKYQLADEDYKLAIDRISDNEHLSKIYKSRGDCQALLGNYSTAYSLFEKAVYYNPKNFRAYWQSGYYKADEFMYEAQLADYDRALEIVHAGGTDASPNDIAQLYRNKSLVLDDLNRKDESMAMINKSIESDPNFVNAYRTRAYYYRTQHKYDKARAEYTNAIMLEKNKVVRSIIYRDMSQMSREMLDLKNALADLDKAIQENPTSGINYWQRSEVYGYMKNFQQAIRECDKAMEYYKRDSFSTASLLQLRAEHKDSTGDSRAAVEDYQLSLDYRPENSDTYYELGRLFKTKLKNNDLALANFSKARDLARRKKDSVTLAYIETVSGNKEEGLKIMHAVLSGTPEKNRYSYIWNLHNMGCMYALAGNSVKALEYVDKSMKAGFDDYRHLVMDRELVSLMKLPQWKAMLVKYKVPQVKK